MERRRKQRIKKGTGEKEGRRKQRINKGRGKGREDAE